MVVALRTRNGIPPTCSVASGLNDTLHADSCDERHRLAFAVYPTRTPPRPHTHPRAYVLARLLLCA